MSHTIGTESSRRWCAAHHLKTQRKKFEHLRNAGVYMPQITNVLSNETQGQEFRL
jgi:hypothetical protein